VRIDARVTSAGALAAGGTVALLVAACGALAWAEGSPLVPRQAGLAAAAGAPLFLGLLAAAFAVYVAALLLLRGGGPRLGAVAAVAVVVQLVPLGAPLLLSTDAWTYWDYGRLAALHDVNPYAHPPSARPDDPAFRAMGARWRERTTVYGPAFTLASEGVAHAARSSADAAAWAFKAAAGVAMLAAAGLVALVSRRSALALAFVGWNPVLAVHGAGGGHNDALVGALAVAALALAATGRLRGSGAAWVLAAAVKWVPLVFLALQLLAFRRAGRWRRLLAGAAAGAVAVAAIASWRYGVHWLAALGPLVDNAGLETRYAVPHRLQELGLPRAAALALAAGVLVLGLAWLAVSAARGSPRLGRAACLVLATTPYLAVWYLAWAVPLAAADEDDRIARLAVLALCAYLLPQAVPL